ncbi:MAG: SOS response-associated peptidase [Planctomycetaceae bacterium]|nr:SOS response-associated peptidase [Planctomycetaceae bacterium]
MCHHYIAGRTRTSEARSIVTAWDDEFSLRGNHYQMLLPDAGFYPLDLVPHIRLDDAGQRVLAPAQWGFLPSWWKPSDKTPKRTTFQRKCFNARSEDIEAKPTYRQAFRARRCLIPASAFFERKHYFELRGDRPRSFAMAGVWERWHGGDGETIESCTILTTSANDVVASVGHPRMPVVFSSEAQYAAWLNPDVVERGPLEDLLRPTPADIWVCRPEGEFQSRSTAADETPHQTHLF